MKSKEKIKSKERIVSVEISYKVTKKSSIARQTVFIDANNIGERKEIELYPNKIESVIVKVLDVDKLNKQAEKMEAY